MAKHKSVHDVLERTGLPLLIIVLVPIAVAAYVVWSSNLNSPSQTAPASSTAAEPASTTSPPANLSLNDPQSLPQQVTAAELVPFSFTIQNASDRQATYQYKVSVHWSTGENDVIDENVLALGAGASTVIQEQLKFEIATETAQVTLQLPQTSQAVRFTLPAAQ